MANFNIIFSGLMCHVALDSQHRAATIIRDSHHSPRIWVRSGDVLSPAPTFQEEIQAENGVLGWKIFTIPSDARIEFSGLKTGAVAAPPQPSVPIITELMPNFVPSEEILATQQHAWVRGYVIYSGGTFSVNCYHYDSARFKNTEEFHCRAKELVLTTEAAAGAQSVTLTDVISGRTMTVGVDSIIAFTQIDKGSPGSDHLLYAHISKGATAILQIEKKPADCPVGGCLLPQPIVQSIGVECMSTQWP